MSNAPDLRDRVWAELPDGRARMGLGLHRLAWTTRDLQAFIDDTLRPSGRTWVSGSYGAVAELSIGEDEKVERESTGTMFQARTARGAISFHLSEQVRALAFGTGQTPATEIVVLALPREQVVNSAPDGLTLIELDKWKSSGSDDFL